MFHRPSIEETREGNLIFTPFSEVGGDFADFFTLPDGLIGLYLGDLVGKGLPAAMYGALIMGTLRGIHKTGTDTARVLSLLNERPAQRPIQGRFCSTLYALFNPATLELTFSNAGIPLPLLVSGSTCQSLGEGGLPSGLFPGAGYSTHVVRLTPGGSVLFATDGLHEWQSRDGIEFGDEQIGEIWLQCQGKSAGSEQRLRHLHEMKRHLHTDRVGKFLDPGVEESEALVEAAQLNTMVDEAEVHLAVARGPAVGFGSRHEL